MLPVLALLALLAAPAHGVAPLEIDILEAYLATHDRAPGAPHCSRHHGILMTPIGATGARGAGTNRILEEHAAFHAEMGDQPGGGFRPTPDDADRYGIVFFEWHRHFLAQYDAWRLANGHAPLAPWDPGTPMPPELAYPYPERACSDGRNDDPQHPLPTWATVAGGDEKDPLFGHERLCDFADLNQLGKSIAMEYHWQFHSRIGGDMVGGRGPLDPAFWAGHRFIDRLMDAWSEACDRDTAPAATIGEARVPAPDVALVLGAAALALGKRRK